MNPLGIALAFVIFWLITGLGMFLFFVNILPLVREARLATRMHLVVPVRLRHTAVLTLRAALVVVGGAMMWAGGYATFMVIYH